MDKLTEKQSDSTMIHVRIDKDLKEDFEYILGEMGLSVTGAIKLFAKTVVREKKIPFEIKTSE